MLDDQIAYLYSIVNGQNAQPTAGAYERYKDLRAELQPHLDRLSTLLQEDVAPFAQRLTREGDERIIVPALSALDP